MRRLDELITRYPELAECREYIEQAYHIIKDSYLKQGKLLIAGNGGSSSDADHLVGELMKGFVMKRPITTGLYDRIREINQTMADEMAEKLQVGLPAISLSNHSSLNTAYINDIGSDYCFAQQVLGYAKEEDVFLGISTSGNAKNVNAAAVLAKAMGLKIITLTGRDGGRLKAVSNVSIRVPQDETYKIQELHLPVYHVLCLMLEEYFFDR